MSRMRIRSTLAVGATTLALAAGAFARSGPVAGNASSHREAPLTAADPQIDNTDVYAFVSPDKPNTVSFVSSWIPFEEPAGGPNFYTWAEHTNYDIKICNDGDAAAEITYRWNFKTHYRNPTRSSSTTGPVTSLGDQNLNIYQTYDLPDRSGNGQRKLINNAKVAPSNVGDASMPNYNADLFDAAITPICGRPQHHSWVGQSDDPFFLDLRVFDLLYGGDLSESGDDTLDGFNVNTFALQVPTKEVPVVPTTRSSVCGARHRVRACASGTGRKPDVLGQGCPGLTTGHAARERGRRPRGREGLLQRLEAEGRPRTLPKVQDPELPHLVNAVYGTECRTPTRTPQGSSVRT